LNLLNQFCHFFSIPASFSRSYYFLDFFQIFFDIFFFVFFHFHFFFRNSKMGNNILHDHLYFQGKQVLFCYSISFVYDVKQLGTLGEVFRILFCQLIWSLLVDAGFYQLVKRSLLFFLQL
jgi:hypothetical protein